MMAIRILFLKLVGLVTLLLVASDESRWCKNLRRDNGKWSTCALGNKVKYVNLNEALMTCKMLSTTLKGWNMVSNPCDPCSWNTMIKVK